MWFWVVLAEPRVPNPTVLWRLGARPSKSWRLNHETCWMQWHFTPNCRIWGDKLTLERPEYASMLSETLSEPPPSYFWGKVDHRLPRICTTRILWWLEKIAAVGWAAVGRLSRERSAIGYLRKPPVYFGNPKPSFLNMTCLWPQWSTLQDATDCPDAAVLLCPCASCLQTTHLVAL